MIVLALVLACGRGGEALPPPAPPFEQRWYVVELRGTPIGAEDYRAADGGRVVWRQRTYPFLLGGAVHERTTTRRVTLGPDGDVRDAREVDASGRERTLTVEEALAAEVVEAPLAVRRVPERPEVAPVDPAEALRRPAPEGLRAPTYARFQVDGAAVEIRAPLPLELSREGRDALRRLVGDVNQALDWAPSPVAVDGLEALAAGSGDCKAHAAALVALAAQRGLRARPVAGLVWRDAPRVGLYPHAWAEVEVDGRWVPVDPTLRQVPADATHLPLAPRQVLGADVALVEAR